MHISRPDASGRCLHDGVLENLAKRVAKRVANRVANQIGGQIRLISGEQWCACVCVIMLVASRDW